MRRITITNRYSLLLSLQLMNTNKTAMSFTSQVLKLYRRPFLENMRSQPNMALKTGHTSGTNMMKATSMPHQMLCHIVNSTTLLILDIQPLVKSITVHQMPLSMGMNYQHWYYGRHVLLHVLIGCDEHCRFYKLLELIYQGVWISIHLQDLGIYKIGVYVPTKVKIMIL